MRLILAVIIIVSIGARAHAQVLEGVRLFKDPRLDVLSKRPALLAAEAAKAATAAEKPKAAVEKKNDRPTIASEIKIGKKQVTGSIMTKNGFRIVIYNGTDRSKALSVKNAFSKGYPGQRSYLAYQVPNFKIKVGDFEDKKDAAMFLKKIGSSFPGAFLTPDQVTIKNIMVR
jgi:hypothetical protein